MHISIEFPVADQGFPKVERQSQRLGASAYYYLAKFRWKLRINEENWNGGV